MKLSDETIEILKNYSTLNSSLLFRKGSVLTTITPQSSVLAIARVVESFPSDFAIYDIVKMLSKLTLYPNSELEFGPDRLIFKSTDGRRSDYIKYCSTKVIITPPEKELVLDKPDYEFTLSAGDLAWQRKSAGISGSQHFVFEGDGKHILFKSTDVKDDSSDVSATILTDCGGAKFRCVIKGDNFKMLDGNYLVKISKGGLVKFENQDKPIVYYVAAEAGLSDFK